MYNGNFEVEQNREPIKKKSNPYYVFLSISELGSSVSHLLYCALLHVMKHTIVMLKSRLKQKHQLGISPSGMNH